MLQPQSLISLLIKTSASIHTNRFVFLVTVSILIAVINSLPSCVQTKICVTSSAESPTRIPDIRLLTADIGIPVPVECRYPTYRGSRYNLVPS